jgi:hypothetical protein
MKKQILFFAGLVLSLSTFSKGVDRSEIAIPDIPGYKTVKADFHTHTVFSDGEVWPNVRIEEAWREGLDAIAITDHLEYRPNKRDIVKNHNRPNVLAARAAGPLGIIVIEGVEITRKYPPGHLNALFIKDADSIASFDYKESIKEAIEQGAFIQYNHPNRELAEIHYEWLEKGWIHGVEVGNGSTWRDYTIGWCNRYNLAMISNTDMHKTSEFFRLNREINRRPLTLVFAKEKSKEAIREAMFNRRTVAWTEDNIAGNSEILEPLIRACVKIDKIHYTDRRGNRYLKITNVSDLPIKLVNTEGDSCPKEIMLKGRTTVNTSVKGEGTVKGNYRVVNWFLEPEKTLSIEIVFPEG